MQGFNMGRYIPPASQDASLAFGKVGGFNSQKSHPLGSRFSKAKDGLIKIRFEMPFDVWCENCKPEFLIKQGIRFNAEKKKAGNYLSTPIWEFSFRHPPCSGTISIRTDPENTQYVVSGGGRKKAGAPTTALDRDYGEILTEEERERRRNDAFARLEGEVEEKVLKNTNESQIKELYALQSRDWEDPYAANQNLRRSFRVGRKQREISSKEKEDISERYGLGFELVDHDEDDAVRASLVEYGSSQHGLDSALAKPLFETRNPERPPKRPPGMTRSEWTKQTAKASFNSEVSANTKAKLNPFVENADWSVARKRMRLPEPSEDEDVKAKKSMRLQDHNDLSDAQKSLVSYDDSDGD